MLSDTISGSNDAVNGVGQGSVLNQLLFTYHVNDLPAASPEYIIKLYEDHSKA